MYQLFLDTHGELITVSFINGNEEFTREVLSEMHSTTLLPLIDEMLKEKNIKLNDFNKIIVVNGPGSFTGIRIGLTVAKTISYSLNIPIYVISSLKMYLLSDDINDKRMSVIEDPKGFYVGFEDKEIYSESLEKYNDYRIVKNKINVLKVADYCKALELINVHAVKANYVKTIEVLK